MTNARISTATFTQALSAVAVVLSLVFVGLEVRESARQTALNTQSLQVGAYQDLLGRIMAINTMAMQDPELNIVSEAISFADLSPLEARREVSRYVFIIRHGDLAYYQYELGMLPEDRLESALGMLNDNLCSPLFRETWDRFRDNFVARYQAFLDAKLASPEGC